MCLCFSFSFSALKTHHIIFRLAHICHFNPSHLKSSKNSLSLSKGIIDIGFCFVLFCHFPLIKWLYWGSREGAVVRALALHKCGPGLIPGLGIICGLSLLLVLVLALRGFYLGTPILFSPLLKNHVSKFQIDPESDGHRFVSRKRLLDVSLVKTHPFLPLFFLNSLWISN